jgi:hypothetical protein
MTVRKGSGFWRFDGGVAAANRSLHERSVRQRGEGGGKLPRPATRRTKMKEARVRVGRSGTDARPMYVLRGRVLWQSSEVRQHGWRYEGETDCGEKQIYFCQKPGLG